MIWVWKSLGKGQFKRIGRASSVVALWIEVLLHKHPGSLPSRPPADLDCRLDDIQARGDRVKQFHYFSSFGCLQLVSDCERSKESVSTGRRPGQTKPNIPLSFFNTIEQTVLYVFLQKYSGLRTTKLAFGISSFSPKQTGTLQCSPVYSISLPHFHFPSIYSFYLNESYTQDDTVSTS